MKFLWLKNLTGLFETPENINVDREILIKKNFPIS